VAAAMIVATVLASLAGVVVVSYGVEALRRVPHPPGKLAWAPDAPVGYADLGGVRVRYLQTGAGPALLLLHTLRTQLDIFERVVPRLAACFTVYAFDYPGHGWSDIPDANYAPEDFYRWTGAFLDRLRVDRATLAGISIGGTIALLLAARRHPSVAGVIAINPYDYPPDGGIRHSSLMARLILGPAGVPILGSTLMRLRSRFVSDRIMEGGVANHAVLTAALKREMYEVGARRGHYQGFLRLLAHEHEWAKARAEYPNISVPVSVIYGEQDWAPGRVRLQERSLIPASAAATLPGGHFLSLDRPDELAELITRFHMDHRLNTDNRPG
jgi:pimeloyl-ACP methyl ester carboxylesterase